MSNDDELLAAYLDGVAELDGDERRRIEARLHDDPVARVEADATRAILDQLRALPGDASEPDWNALERAIRVEVGDEARPWWRRMRWLVPVGVLAAVAAVATLALVWLHQPAPAPRVALAHPEAAAPAAAPESEPSAATALWLDGQAFELGDVDPAALPTPGMPALDDARDTLAESVDDLGILPVDDLGWVDSLDDKAIDRAEHWLARKKG